MRISEFAVLTESISGKDIFVKQFVNELVDYINSMGKSGHPVKMMDYMRSYFQRYNMQLSSQQRDMLRQACTEVDNEYNYFISKQQKPGAKPAQQSATKTTQQQAGSQAFDQMATQLGGKPQSQGNQAFDQMAAQLYKGSPTSAPAATNASSTPTEPTTTPQGPSALSAHMMPSQAALAAKKQKANAAYYGLDDRIEPTMEGVMGDIWNSVKSKASTLAGSFLSKLGLGSVNKLANLAYTILMTQPSLAQQGQGGYGRGYSSGMGGYGRGYGGQMRQPRQPKAAQAAKPQKDLQVTPQVQQIVKSIKAMKGPEFEADLTQIIKTALWNLYGGNKTAYNDAVNKLFSKQPTKQPEPQAEPQAEPENVGGKNAFNQMANSLRTNPMKAKPVRQPVPHPADDNPNIGLGSNE